MPKAIRLNSIRQFFVHLILFAGLFFASYVADAQIKVVSTLQCQSDTSPDDPAFQQGTEKYFDIRYTAEKKLQVTYSQATISNGALFSAAETQTADWDVLGGRIFGRWTNKAYLTLMQFDSGWRGYLMLPSDMDPKANPFGVAEIQLKCGNVRWW